METIVFIDSEITNEGVTADLGAIKENKQFHSADKQDFSDFVKDIKFVCGHNIIHHDLKYIGELFDKNNTPDYIDTLYISPLVFPKKPYHISIFYAMYDFVLVLNDFSYRLFRCTHRKFITANKTVCQYCFL